MSTDTLPINYTPAITTKPADIFIDGSGFFLLVDDVIVDQSWKESDLFDEHANAILADPQRAFLWRESSKLLNAIADGRESQLSSRRRMTWCEMGQHDMQPYNCYCYSWRDIYVCGECLDRHIAVYFPKRDPAPKTEPKTALLTSLIPDPFD
jgi:hypothetical protein